VSRMRPILNRDIIISSWRDVRFEEDQGVGVFYWKEFGERLRVPGLAP